jgi:hypothetical protein
MDSLKTNGTALVVLHFVVTVLVLLITIQFVTVQWKRGNVSQMIRNKFVVLTTAMGVCTILSEVFIIPRLWLFDYPLSSERLSQQTADDILYFNSLFLIIAIMTHPCLLFIRTRALVETHSPRLMKAYKFITGTVIVMGTLSALIRTRLFFQGETSATKMIDLLYAMTSAIFGFCVGCMDLISTHWFAEYVRQASKAIQPQSQMKQMIIARMGIYICLCSLFNTIVFAASRATGNVVVRNWLVLATMYGSFGIVALWMIMKIKLDPQVVAQQLSATENSPNNVTMVKTNSTT